MDQQTLYNTGASRCLNAERMWHNNRWNSVGALKTTRVAANNYVQRRAEIENPANVADTGRVKIATVVTATIAEEARFRKWHVFFR